MTAVFGSVVSMDSIDSYPTVVSAPVVFMMAFQVKSMSAEVIGVPSAHTALSLILYEMVNGLWVIPPLSRVGASARTGEATKFPFRSSTIAYERSEERRVGKEC